MTSEKGKTHMGQFQENDPLLHQWLNHQLPPEEEGLLQGHEKTVEIIKKIDEWEVPAGMDESDAWEALRARISGGGARVVTLNSRPGQMVWWLTSAASLLLIGALAWWWWPNQTSFYAPAGTMITCYLPDSTEVILNADSRIEFFSNHWDSNREVVLKGEAYFEVTPGSTFEVRSDFGTVTVVGTGFNVRARDKSLMVACMHGKVRVDAPNGHSTLLTAGWAVTSGSDAPLKPYSCPANQVAPWLRGEFFFEKAPLNFVFSEVQRQFDVKIEGEWGKDRLYTGYFTNQNLPKALELVVEPMGLKYELLPDNRVIIQP